MTTLVFGQGAIAESICASLDGARLISCASLTTEEDVDRCVDGALEADEVIRGVVLVHESFPQEAFSSLTAADWRGVLAESLRRPFLIVRRVVDDLLGEADGGRIILVVPDVFDGAPGHTHNAASATALHGFSRSVAKEYGRRGITSNVVAYPLGDPAAHAEAVAQATEFLLEEGSAFITGDLIRVGAQ